MALTSLKTETFDILGHTVHLQTSADADRMLAEAANCDDKDPYWGVVWNAALDSARCVLRTSWPPGLRALELGCGTGLLGVAGLMAGLQVTFSDHMQEAVDLAVSNAKLNGFSKPCGMLLDWANPGRNKYELLLASDVLYESSLHHSLLNVANSMLEPGCSFRIGDPGRENAFEFMRTANADGWSVEVFDNNLQQVNVPKRAEFLWIVLRK